MTEEVVDDERIPGRFGLAGNLAQCTQDLITRHVRPFLRREREAVHCPCQSEGLCDLMGNPVRIREIESSILIMGVADADVIHVSTVVICDVRTPMLPLGQASYPDQDKGVCDGTADY
jgi:hypothetical protein